MKNLNTYTPAFNAIQKKQALIDSITPTLEFNPYDIRISHPAGKMDGVNCISTYAALNPCCLARINKYKNDTSTACSNCFSSTSGTLNFKKVITPYIINSMNLSREIIPVEYLPLIYDLFFRFESHGDLINTTHAINYCNICLKNQWCKFSIWTKNPGFLNAAFKAVGGKPANLTVIYSSLRLNQVESDIFNKYDFIDKIFTVYSSEYALTNNIKINCGNKHCKQCQNCYLNAEKSPVYINEILKSDIDNYLNQGGKIY